MKVAFLSLLSSHAFWAFAASEAVFKPTSIKAPFIEQFTEDWDSRWKSSAATKQMPEGFSLGENDDPETLFRYRGEWAVEKPWKNGVSGDKGLVAKTSAAHHAISVSFPKVLNPEGKDLVVQYDLKLQEELQCGGAYIKLLTDSKEGIKYNEFDDRTPYTIMFGPDKCGTTNKVHFIFRHQNPLTKKWEEKHYRQAPSIRADTNVHLYTLLVHPNNTFHIYIDQERVKTGSLLEDFDPSVNPPKEIDDPSDKKPEDWVDEPKIPDPDAKKPEDWDEDAPRMVPDEEAEKPTDWLENEPEFVDDPSAEKPDDWDEEEDGKWVAPQVPNPKCEKVAGCGKWVRPNKPNPNYKGKWYAPLIDNPAYKGPWAPKKIPNPDFFEDNTPSKFTKISGLGIEIWTMQGGIMYDNFYVGHSFEDAMKLADETFKVKKSVEDAANEASKKAAEEKAKEEGSTTPESVEDFKAQLTAFFNLATVNPTEAFQKFPVVGGIVGLVFLSPILLYLLLARGSPKDAAYAKRKKDDTATPDVKDDQDEDADDEKEEALRTKKNKD